MGAVVMLIMGVVALAAVVGIVGVVVSLVVALVAKALPLLLIGFVVVKLVQRSERRREVARPVRAEAWLDAR